MTFSHSRTERSTMSYYNACETTHDTTESIDRRNAELAPMSDCNTCGTTDDTLESLELHMAELADEFQLASLRTAEMQEQSENVEAWLETVVVERVETASVLNHPPTLPLKLVIIIAECLAGDGNHGTLANLSATCNIMRRELMPMLCETVILRAPVMFKWDREGYVVRKFFENEGRHTKFLVFSLEKCPSCPLGSIFPNRSLEIWRLIQESNDHVAEDHERVSIIIIKPASVSSLQYLLYFSDDMKQCPGSPSGSNMISYLSMVRVKEQGSLTGLGGHRDAAWKDYCSHSGTDWFFACDETTKDWLRTISYFWTTVRRWVEDVEGVFYLRVHLENSIGALDELIHMLGLLVRIFPNTTFLPIIDISECHHTFSDIWKRAFAFITLCKQLCVVRTIEPGFLYDLLRIDRGGDDHDDAEHAHAPHKTPGLEWRGFQDERVPEGESAKFWLSLHHTRCGEIVYAEKISLV